jgi:succinoglycan biosynthesis protein ExoL
MDARFHKRIESFAYLNYTISWLAYDRKRNKKVLPAQLLPLKHIILGVTEDSNYSQRFIALFKSFFILIRNANILNVNYIYVINLDNALLMYFVAKFKRLKNIKFLYEVADIQPILLKNTLRSKLLQKIEKKLLSKINLLITTSDKFIEHYFAPITKYSGETYILENKLFFNNRTLNRPTNVENYNKKYLNVGVFGAFRCSKSLDMIMELSEKLDNVKFILRGYFLDSTAIYEKTLSKYKNISYLGSYSYPTDLPEIYKQIDICWSLDFSSEGGNSDWLLPNRLYEAGYFGVPLVARSDTYLGEKIRKMNLGWTIETDYLNELSRFFKEITVNEITTFKKNILNSPESNFLINNDLIKFNTLIEEL